MQKTGDNEDMTSEDDGRGNDDREEMELDITSPVCSGGQFNAMLRFLIAQRPVPSSLTTYYELLTSCDADMDSRTRSMHDVLLFYT